MDNWAAGDLALCVRGGYLAGRGDLGDYPVAGRIYSVSCVRFQMWQSSPADLGLILPDAPPNCIGDHAWWAYRFRKIHPHAPDAEDRETIELLTGKPLLAPVGGGEG